MAEEKKQAPVGEAKGGGKEKEKSKLSSQEAKAVAPEKKEEAPSERKKIRKINKLSLEEIEEKLKNVATTMRGISSKYAQHLLQRREELLQKKRVSS